MPSKLLYTLPGLAVAAALAAAAFVSGPAFAAKSFPTPKDVLVCTKLFFEDHAKFVQDCGGDLPPPPATPPGSLSTPVEPCRDVVAPPSGGPSGGSVSIVAAKCGIISVTSYDGLPVYRFKYVGTDTWFYGLMIEDVLRDGRYASAVTTYANGVRTLDYEAIGLVVPDAEAMHDAGWRAVNYLASLG